MVGVPHSPLKPLGFHFPESFSLVGREGLTHGSITFNFSTSNLPNENLVNILGGHGPDKSYYRGFSINTVSISTDF